MDKKVRNASKTLELDEHLDRKPGNLSGGQRQRVAMGRAIVRDADAFLFDEPLSNLDAKLRGQMRTEIARLQKRLGITTVYVTHDQTEAMTLGDRVAVLKRGVLQQLATPRELYTNPGNLFVAGFIGSPPMNFVPAEVDGTSVKMPFGTVELPAEKTENAQGKGLLIAGIRPEHFEDASVKDDVRRGLDLPGHGGRRGVARQRGLRLHPVRGAAGGPEAAHPAGAATSTATRCAPSSSCPSTGPAASPRATRPRSGWTPPRSTSSTPRPARTSPSTSRGAGRIPEREDPKAKAQAEKMADQGEEVHSAEEA